MFGFRRSRSPHYPPGLGSAPHPDDWAVPLTPDDVDVLVTGLVEKDRLLRFHRPDIVVSPMFGHRAQAAAIGRSAVYAAHLGHETIPYPTTHLIELAYVLGDLHRWASSAAITDKFGNVELKLRSLEALARARKWRYQCADTGSQLDPTWEWKGTPVSVDATGQRALPPAKER